MVLLDNGGRTSNEAILLAPPQDLRGVIAHLWIQTGEHTARDWRVVADASPHLIAVVATQNGTPQMSVGLVGPRSHAASLDTSNRTMTAGVRFVPGVLPLLTGRSARDFAELSIDVDRVFTARTLDGLELGHDSPPELILRELVRLVRRASTGRAANADIARALWRARKVEHLAAALSRPARSLRELMYREVGLNPKRTLRILRLHVALGKARSPFRSWSHIAQAAGYADQAHLTREARALLGETPSVWAGRGSAVSFKTRPSLAR